MKVRKNNRLWFCVVGAFILFPRYLRFAIAETRRTGKRFTWADGERQYQDRLKTGRVKSKAYRLGAALSRREINAKN